MYRCVGTPWLSRARYISTDCSGGTRGSFSPAKNSVGVLTFEASFSGERLQNSSIGALSCHGVPPNQVDRSARKSLCAYRDTQSDADAPADAALKRLVTVISLTEIGRAHV